MSYKHLSLGERHYIELSIKNEKTLIEIANDLGRSQSSISREMHMHAVTINEEAIEKSAQWDGLHGVITNTTKESVEDILAHYQGLWQIEESFRIQKHDLKVRPIYHWNESRIRAHLAIAIYVILLCSSYGIQS